MKRIFRFFKKDGSFKDLDIELVTSIKLDSSEMIHFDLLKDGKWRPDIQSQNNRRFF